MGCAKGVSTGVVRHQSALSFQATTPPPTHGRQQLPASDHQHTQEAHPAALTMLPTHHQGRRSAGGSTSASVQRVQNVPSPISARSRAVVGITLPRPAPGSLRELRELQRAHTPLQRSAFEHELKAHPDKAWVSWLLNGIDNGVSTGYNGPHFSYTARNLTSALQHPEVVDDGLQKEVESGRILGPFCQPPLKNLRTSGLGAVPKKNEKWRVILHLSAPEGLSINDFISKDEFSMHVLLHTRRRCSPAQQI